jgi:hypothetical protein
MARNSLARRRRRAHTPAKSIHPCEHFGTQRRSLFQARGIVELTRFAVASRLEDLDETAVIDSLEAASKLINDACGSLEMNSGERSSTRLRHDLEQCSSDTSERRNRSRVDRKPPRLE